VFSLHASSNRRIISLSRRYNILSLFSGICCIASLPLDHHWPSSFTSVSHGHLGMFINLFDFSHVPNLLLHALLISFLLPLFRLHDRDVFHVSFDLMSSNLIVLWACCYLTIHSPVHYFMESSLRRHIHLPSPRLATDTGSVGPFLCTPIVRTRTPVRSIPRRRCAYVTEHHTLFFSSSISILKHSLSFAIWQHFAGIQRVRSV
jgi:hypothetical protein